ncbi:hypothetical protein CHS0354_000731 [Potamilus streckersoni]|uniref:Methylisocitrate lyase n=1 Tax=Potamilus streckersoni TaxID=2493646 RepID=A0AAE0T869_9BIVA|nr:hypothetical protein CHS0354_000731 [Potamilus streckersoni]
MALCNLQYPQGSNHYTILCKLNFPQRHDKQTEETAPAKLRRLLSGKGILQAPGVFNPLVALCAEQEGFEVAYISGAAFSASKGLPDLGLFTLSELSVTVREITRATRLALIVDIDTGFGEALNVARTIREIEEVGAAAVQIEDQVMPKKCGHLNGKALIPAEEMIEKIRACKASAKELVIIGRTDARGVIGIEETVRRANLYIEAGADVIFPEALEIKEEFEYVAKHVKAPLLANMTEFGKTPYFSSTEFEAMGYKIVIYPVTSLRVAMKAVENVFKEIKNTGTQKNFESEMQTRKELYELIRYHEYESFDMSFRQKESFR